MTSASLPFAAGPPSDPRAPHHAYETTLAGERVALLADKAVFWPREHTLLIADLHLGKAAAFRAGGVAVPRGTTAADLARLGALIATTGAQRLVVLGDFLHARASRVAAIDASFSAWRESHRQLAVTLVRGNHDARAGDPPDSWGVEVVAEPHAAPPFLLCHLPCAPPTGYALCGHVHPGVRLAGSGFDSARLPCFLLGERRALLPAFGRFTGLALVEPGASERVVAIAGRRLFPLVRGGVSIS